MPAAEKTPGALVGPPDSTITVRARPMLRHRNARASSRYSPCSSPDTAMRYASSEPAVRSTVIRAAAAPGVPQSRPSPVAHIASAPGTP